MQFSLSVSRVLLLKMTVQHAGAPQAPSDTQRQSCGLTDTKLKYSNSIFSDQFFLPVLHPNGLVNALAGLQSSTVTILNKHT